MLEVIFLMAYMNTKIYRPKTEKELHSLIKAKLDRLNLNLIQYEFKYESDIPDFLCIDEEGKLTVIEVKLGLDKNIVLQGMRYYKMANKYKYLIAKEIPKVKVGKEIQLILIAEAFDNDSINIIEHLDIQINAYTYLSIINEDDKKRDIHFNEVLITPSEPFKPVKIPKIKDHIEKLSTDQLKRSYEEIIKAIKDLAPGIDLIPLQKYLGLKYKGRNIATIHARKSFFWLISFKYNKEGKYEENVYAKVINGDESEIDGVFDTIRSIIKMVDS